MSLLLAPAASAAPSWTPWERDHAIGQFRSFLIIRQPGDGFCYAKQSFHMDSGKMELIFDGEVVTVLLPHVASGRWDVTFWVDSGKRQTIRHEQIMAPDSFHLPRDRLGDLKSGNYLNVRVSPDGAEPFSQTISLLGFTAAGNKLDDPECTNAARLDERADEDTRETA